VILTACGGSAGSQPPAAERPTTTRAAAAYRTPTPEIQPVRFPEDEAPHDMLTEWWYYTGHLFAPDGTRYGFQFVIFQVRRSVFPPAYAAHFAITDNARGTFHVAERVGLGAERPAAAGFDLSLDGWTMRGALGSDRIQAAMPGYAIDLDLHAAKPPALHNDIGYIEYGPAGGSYYYSRTRMEISGTLSVDDRPLAVAGQAWMDHQWGNFFAVGEGGWDWFAVQLDDGYDLAVYLVRDATGVVVWAYGTLVAPDGGTRALEATDYQVTATGTWTSPTSGATYPSGWMIALVDEDWQLTLTPTLQDQELQTPASTGVTYWEGAVTISGSVAGRSVSGFGYVELTGYAD
jgi:predicted secreted hydrolase